MPCYSRDEWIWPGYVPLRRVTAIVGGIKATTTLVAIKMAATVLTGGRWPDGMYAERQDLVWLTAQHGTTLAMRNALIAAGAEIDLSSEIGPIHIVEPELDDFGLPIHHFRHDLQRLECELSSTDKVGAAVIDYVSPYLGEDIEQAIPGLRGAFAALKDFAAKFGIAVILPCHGGSSVIRKAIETLRADPRLHCVFVVEGANPGTMALAKGSPVATDIFGFRLRMKPAPWEGSAPAVEGEHAMPVKSAAKPAPWTRDSRANGDITDTRNPDVSHESLSPGLVPAQSDEVPPTPPAPPASPGVASAIEGAAATRETSSQSLRPGAGANVGKPLIGLTKALSRTPTVPVTPFYSKPAGRPAPFSSVTPKEAEQKGRRLAKPTVGGKQTVNREQSAPTKRSTKLRKHGKRK
jgi:hypothetical protein